MVASLGAALVFRGLRGLSTQSENQKSISKAHVKSPCQEVTKSRSRIRGIKKMSR